MSNFALKPSEIEHEVTEILAAGLVPFVRSEPGLGKSSIFRQIARKAALKFIDNRVSQMTPEDFMGLPVRSTRPDGTVYAEFAPFTMFPVEGTPLPKGMNGWFLSMDEFNSGNKSIQAPSYKLVLDREVNQSKLHDNVFIACAGNLDTDRAITIPMSTALKSRLVHLRMKADLDEFILFAHRNKFDPRIMGFLAFQPDKLHAFKPDSEDDTFPCPRTWEFVSKLITGKGHDDLSKATIAGTIGKGTMVEFMAFLREFNSLPRYEDIVKDPANCPVPANPSTRYALVTMLLERLKDTDFAQVIEYVKRFSTEFQAVFFRNVLVRYPLLRRDRAFSANVNTFTNYVKGIPEAA